MVKFTQTLLFSLLFFTGLNAIAQCPVNASFSRIRVCNNNTIQFNDLSFLSGTGQITGWDWDFGDASPNSNVQNPTHDFPSSGTYNVTLTVTDFGM